MGRGLRRRPAPRGKPENCKFPHDALQRQTHAIADAHPVRRFDAFRVEMDFAAVDGSGCQAARLEKSGMPKPFIETMVISFFFGCHKYLIWSEPLERLRAKSL